MDVSPEWEFWNETSNLGIQELWNLSYGEIQETVRFSWPNNFQNLLEPTMDSFRVHEMTGWLRVSRRQSSSRLVLMTVWPAHFVLVTIQPSNVLTHWESTLRGPRRNTAPSQRSGWPLWRGFWPWLHRKSRSIVSQYTVMYSMCTGREYNLCIPRL